ncbi:MAG: phenylacetate--CoA ligase, partial [Desulfobulbaceae bacterium]|nr:phenylacetate--CoA ligase [Desulfobulbaceae bacterium]
SEEIISDAVKGLETLRQQIQADIKDLIGSSCKISLKEPKTIARSEGKAVRVIDKRKA